MSSVASEIARVGDILCELVAAMHRDVRAGADRYCAPLPAT